MATNVTQQPNALFQGYDSFLGQVRDVAVGGTTTKANAQSSSLVTICTDSDSVMQALSVSASLSGGFAGTSFEASSTFSQSLSLTSKSVVVIVNVVVGTGTDQADSYSLSGTPPSGVQDFFNDYGDSFVSEVVLGGQYSAAFIFDSQTESQQQQIQASLKGSSGVLSGSLSVSLSSAATSAHTNYRISQQVFGVSHPVYPDNKDADAIIAFAQSFSTQIDAPTVLGFKITGYERVPNTPSDFTAVAANRNRLDTATFVDATNSLIALANQTAAIQSMYTSYGYMGDAQFAANSTQVAQDRAALSTLIGNIEKSVTGTYSTLKLPSLGYGTPQVSFALIEPSVPWELVGIATTFSDLTTAQVVAGVKPASITLSSGAILIDYNDGTSGTHGTLSPTPDGPLTIAASDSIAAVTVSSRPPCVMSIEVTTASGQSIGSAAEGQFPQTSYSAPPAIIGFLGSTIPGDSGTILSTLAPISIKLSPAIWITSPVAPAVKRRAPAQGLAQAPA